MKNHYMVTCKTVCKINYLKKISCALHLVGSLSHCERKLICGDGRVPKEEDLLLLTPLPFNICKLYDSFLLLFRLETF